jgi:hypothetical protein
MPDSDRQGGSSISESGPERVGDSGRDADSRPRGEGMMGVVDRGDLPEGEELLVEAGETR